MDAGWLQCLSPICTGAWAGGKFSRLFPQPASEGWADGRDHHQDRETIQKSLEVAVWEMVSSCYSVCSLTVTNFRVDRHTVEAIRIFQLQVLCDFVLVFWFV